jgi:benzoate-CoA ligase
MSPPTASSAQEHDMTDAQAAADPAEVPPPPEAFNFAQHLFGLNSGHASRVAFVDDQGSLTYGALEDRSRRLAGGLRSLGIRREERVLLLMQDGLDWPVAFLGALYAGIVPVAVNTLLTPDDYAYMLEHSRAQAVLVSGALLPALKGALVKSDHEVQKVIVSRPVAPLDFGETALDAFLEQHAPAAKAAPTHADDPAFWLYSSGSTGKPKGTVHTHANLYWTAALYGQPVLGVSEDDVVFSAAKLFFAYGLGNALTFPLSVGATTVLMAERPTPQAVFARLVRHKPTVFAGVPTLYVSMLASNELPAREDTALRICASAGEMLPREVGERFKAHFGADILDGIGSTEMLHIFLSNRSGDIRYGTTGRPVEGYDVELRDEDGRPVPVGEVGDLYIRGPSAALMYWTNRDKSRTTFQGEWVKSGDKYVQDAQGYFIYAGRSDDMLKVSGQYVSPIEVESALVAHPAVLECAVVGRSDADGLTKTMAYVVLRRGENGDEAMRVELKSFVKTRLTPHKYPREFVFVDDLPKTATGKIQRFKLRALDA